MDSLTLKPVDRIFRKNLILSTSSFDPVLHRSFYVDYWMTDLNFHVNELQKNNSHYKSFVDRLRVKFDKCVDAEYQMLDEFFKTKQQTGYAEVITMEIPWFYTDFIKINSMLIDFLNRIDAENYISIADHLSVYDLSTIRSTMEERINPKVLLYPGEGHTLLLKAQESWMAYAEELTGLFYFRYSSVFRHPSARDIRENFLAFLCELRYKQIGNYNDQWIEYWLRSDTY